MGRFAFGTTAALVVIASLELAPAHGQQAATPRNNTQLSFGMNLEQGLAGSGRSGASGRVLAHDRPDMLAPQRRLKQVRLQSIDNLEALHLPGTGE